MDLDPVESGTFWRGRILNFKKRNTSLGSIADPESGIFLPLDPGTGMGEKTGSGMNIQDHFPESLRQFLGLKILKFFHADPDPKFGILFNLDPGWKNSDPGSEIKHPGSATLPFAIIISTVVGYLLSHQEHFYLGKVRRLKLRPVLHCHVFYRTWHRLRVGSGSGE